MSDSAGREDTVLEIEVPPDPLAGHPATAYFWGHVAGSGDVTDGSGRSEAGADDSEGRSRERIEVVANDEASAQALAAVAGGDLSRDTASREYAHDTSITRTDEEYTLSVGDSESGLLGRSGALGLPVDGRGNYRFSAFADHDRELLRGLFEGCGTVCFKSSAGTVGISFVHDDRDLLELTRELIVDCPVEASCDSLSETSSGGYWFGVDDDAGPAFGRWLYEGCEATGLFAPSRRRKLESSLEQAGAYDDL